MKYQQSPLPYLFVTAVVLSVAIYSNLSTDKQLKKPIVYNITNSDSVADENQKILFDATELLTQK